MSATEVQHGTITTDETVEDEDIHEGCAHIYWYDSPIAACGTPQSEDAHMSCPGGSFDYCPCCGVAVCAYCRLLTP